MNAYKELIDGLSGLVLPERIDTFHKVLNYRTRYITVVLEDIFQSQNASAVLRSCDVFGIQDVHIIEKRNVYDINPDITLGSQQWLNLKKYPNYPNNSLEAIKDLKNKGYRIVATTPHTNDVLLSDFNMNRGPVALFFGTELSGLSKQVLDNADEYLKIPMFGFTESLNISVSAAIILHQLTQNLHQQKVNWHLSEAEYDEILFDWLRISVKLSTPVIKRICHSLAVDASKYLR